MSAFAGGRPGMISAATAATAVLMISLVKVHGLQYLLATTVLVGIFQIIAGFLRLGSLMRFVSKSVLTGFVNALAILIFSAQLPELIGAQPYVRHDSTQAVDNLFITTNNESNSFAAGMYSCFNFYCSRIRP